MQGSIGLPLLVLVATDTVGGHRQTHCSQTERTGLGCGSSSTADPAGWLLPLPGDVRTKSGSVVSDHAALQLFAVEDLIPTTVHAWATFLYRTKQSNDPIFIPWFAFAELPEQNFASAASEVAQRLSQSADAIHPRVATAFAQPPESCRAEARQNVSLHQEVQRRA